jgi:deoxyribose-phosphate aldolase
MNQMNYTYEDVAGMIDHSLLNPTLPVVELDLGIELANRYQVASVCIMPFYLKRCAEMLRGSGVAPSTTIGFPHGGHTIATKLAESKQALADGCLELDMVVNISQVLSGHFDYVQDEIKQIVDLAHDSGAKVKVIFENCYLNREQKVALCEICTEVGADWVKTSTGYGTGGFTFEDIDLMLKNVGKGVQVKAAGGVRDLDTLLKLREMGVTRSGASRTAAMLDECRRRLEMPAVAS